MKRLLLITPFLFFACSSSDDNDCSQKWEYKEYCKKTSNCGTCISESEATLRTSTFSCDELKNISEGTEIHLSERDSDCFKFYRKYIKKVN